MSEEQEVKHNYIVEIEEVITRQYVVEDVNSPEEAEQVAEDWLNDGEEGTETDSEILNIDCYPVENKEEIS
jgi:hypothetical protein